MLNLTPLLAQLKVQDKLNPTVLKQLDLAAHDEFAWAQRAVVKEVESQYNAGKPVRIIVLKARQLGISTVTEGILFNWAFIHPNTSGLVLANEVPTSEELFQKTRTYWEKWPLQSLYTLKYSTKQHMRWVETGSNLRIATAKNVTSGRGSTFHAVHATECAFYADPHTLWTGLNQTIPQAHGTIVVLESTANGTGNWWHDQWLMAESGDSDYVPMFFPWYLHFEYKLPTKLTIKSELTADERHMLKLGATYENIQWYRWALNNRVGGDEEILRQEYPTTPEDAFVSTGHPIFSQAKLKECYDPKKGFRGILVDNDSGGVSWVADSSGNLTIFKAPVREDRNDRYFISGDPSRSVTGDPSCIQVINRKTMEQVAVWHGRIDPISFGEEMMRVGKYYNWGMVCPEIEGGGQATVATVINRNYPNIWQHRWADKSPGKIAITYGWAMNFTRKSWCVGTLKRLFIDTSMVIHDVKTYNQLRDYVVLNDGSWGNASPHGHDDAVTSLAIGVTASMTEGPFVEDESGGAIYDMFGRDEEAS